jgi:tellurite resistance protein
MNNSANENLRKLLAGFMDEAAVRQTAEDIEKGEEILGANRAPQPDARVLAEVKRNVAAALRRRRMVVFQKRMLGAAVAAAVVAVSVLTLMRYGDQTNSHQSGMVAAAISSRVWEGADDADVTVLKAEVENIQSELSEAQSDSIGTGGTNSAIGDLETELIEVNGDMWKG